MLLPCGDHWVWPPGDVAGNPEPLRPAAISPAAIGLAVSDRFSVTLLQRHLDAYGQRHRGPRARDAGQDCGALPSSGAGSLAL
jgi:hypothetical protein